MAVAQSQLAWANAIAVYETSVGLGLRFGIGAMAGDSTKSFFKRRTDIPPGEPWIPFDQVDFLLGALVLVWPVADLSWPDVPAILLLSATGHVLVNHLGYWMRAPTPVAKLEVPSHEVGVEVPRRKGDGEAEGRGWPARGPLIRPLPHRASQACPRWNRSPFTSEHGA